LVNMQAYGDLKSGLSLARHKVLTFFLAIIGILVVLGLIFAVITLPFGLAVWFFDPSGDFITQWVNTITAWMLPLSSGSVAVILSVSFLAVILPLTALGIWVLGALFGIAKEYIDTNDTQVEHAFTWLRKMFGPLIGGGVLLAIVIVVPALIVGYLVSWAYGFTTVPYPVDWIEGVAGIVYFFIMLGFFSLLCPAIVDGVGAVDAMKLSFRMARANMGRVFGYLLLFMLILFIFIAPVAIYSTYLVSLGHVFDPMTDVIAAVCTAWTAVGVFFIALHLLPGFVFSLTLIYNSLKGAAPTQMS
jgi:hypothetical protein